MDDLLKNLDRDEIGEGHVAHYIYQLDNDPNEFYLAEIFENKEAYHKNAQRPETNTDYEEMVKYLDEEPAWHDGEIVYSQIS